MKLQRYIKAEIQRDAIERTPEGFLRVPVIATRVGVLPYLDEEGHVVREARLPEEVFKDDSIKTMRGIPITDDHPEEGLVDSTNSRKYIRGYTGEDVKIRDNRFIETTATIVDEEAIRKVLSGEKVEVSMGYTVTKEKTSGRFENSDYDMVQRDIKYNHLAIVHKGRAGSEVKLKLDSNGNQLLQGGIMLVKIKIGDREFEFEKDAAEAVTSLLKKGDDLSAKLDEAKKAVNADSAKLTQELTDSKKEQAILQAKFDDAMSTIEKLKADKSKTLDSAEVERIARTRARVERVAEAVLDDESFEKVENMSTAEIKKAVIKADSESDIPEEKLANEHYVDARFDMIAEKALSSNRDELDSLGRKVVDSDPGKQATNADAVEKARAKQIEDAQKAWTQPLSLSRAS